MGWEDSSRHSNRPRPAAVQVRDLDGSVELVTESPPEYRTSHASRRGMNYARDEPWWKPRYWGKKTWAIVAAVVAVILIIVIVVPVKLSQANRYPNYSRLNYALADECESIRMMGQYHIMNLR